MILQLKEQSPVRPAKWEDVFPYDQVVKSLWAQWEQVDFHRGVNKTLASMKGRYYWLGLTSHVKKWVRIGHECGAKKS